MSQSTRLRNLSALGQVVDGDDLRSPRSLSALTRLAPMKPAAPVTTMYMDFSSVTVLIVAEFFAGDDGRAQFADDDAGRDVGSGSRRPSRRRRRA
jgi:hypothetical protein